MNQIVLSQCVHNALITQIVMSHKSELLKIVMHKDYARLAIFKFNNLYQAAKIVNRCVLIHHVVVIAQFQIALLARYGLDVNHNLLAYLKIVGVDSVRVECV